MTTRLMPLMLVAAALTCGWGCVKPDWIQQTLVTADVTGTWRSISGGLLELTLEQQGSKVDGSMRLTGLPGVSNLLGPVDGTVSGDTFRFTARSGMIVMGEFTASGDEMIGQVRGIGQAAFGGPVQYTLRRVSPPN